MMGKLHRVTSLVVSASLLVLVLATGAFAAKVEQTRFIDPDTGKTVTVDLIPVGCFESSASRYFPLSTLYYNARLGGELATAWKVYPDYSAVITACVKHAYKKGMESTFGIQFYGECFGAASGAYNGYSPYSSLSKRPELCDHGVGKAGAFYIYQFQVVSGVHDNKCNINGGVYEEGQSMMIPNEWTHVGGAKCLLCECSGGKAKGCEVNYHCDSSLGGSYCEKYETKPKACCPTCACVHKGQGMSEGSTWVVRKNSKCHECKCSGGMSACRTMACFCPSGYEPESAAPAGECCPGCKPKPTTPRPTFIIPITKKTTRRPPPTFPPRSKNM